ncbi:hypothetical protein PT974_01112 [Cladobotryum mycophilum]|uniref:Myb-like domain-containing protein n=1 Tax=Cladobotryum mycophilum TaxID=491253 RepID=A0ABR0T3X3_9HYPO
METRNRGKRGAPASTATAPADEAPAAAAAQTRKSTRITRQTANQGTTNPPTVEEPPAVEPEIIIPVNPVIERPKGSILAATPPRRGAIVKDDRSVASIATNRKRDDDELGDDSSQIFSTEDGQEGLDVDGRSEAERALDDAKREVKHICLLDLAITSIELIKLLKDPDYDSTVFQLLLQVKRDTFAAVRKIYEVPTMAPFSTWDWAGDLEHKSAEAIRIATTTVVFANIVTALDWVERTLADELDPLYVLERLDQVFPRAFTLPGQENNRYWELALHIRTSRCIETMAASKTTADPRQIAATVFCEAVENIKAYKGSDYAKLFTKGPYRSLGGLRGQTLIDACSDRMNQMFALISTPDMKFRNPVPVADLRAVFPMKNVLAGLREWLTRLYMASASRFEQIPKDLRLLRYGGWAPHPDDDDNASLAGSQGSTSTVIRPATHESSLFKRPEDIAYLYQAPLPNQQHPPPSQNLSNHNNIAANGGDDDYEDNEEEEEEDDDSSNSFETDPRLNENGKRGTTETSLAARKKRRNLSSSAALRLLLRPDQLLPLPSSSRPNFTDIQRTKAIALQTARAQNPVTYKQRHVWTDHDSAVLIDLIARRHAGWALMDKSDASLFEMPRNAQAYRDRARNMKVDFLITDSVLPPGFDLVTLGKKEIDRLMRLGKNPSRREDDLDEEGRPIRTDYRHAHPRLLQSQE